MRRAGRSGPVEDGLQGIAPDDVVLEPGAGLIEHLDAVLAVALDQVAPGHAGGILLESDAGSLVGPDGVVLEGGLGSLCDHDTRGAVVLDGVAAHDERRVPGDQQTGPAVAAQQVVLHRRSRLEGDLYAMIPVFLDQVAQRYPARHSLVGDAAGLVAPDAIALQAGDGLLIHLDPGRAVVLHGIAAGHPPGSTPVVQAHTVALHHALLQHHEAVVSENGPVAPVLLEHVAQRPATTRVEDRQPGMAVVAEAVVLQQHLRLVGDLEAVEGIAAEFAAHDGASGSASHPQPIASQAIPPVEGPAAEASILNVEEAPFNHQHLGGKLALVDEADPLDHESSSPIEAHQRARCARDDTGPVAPRPHQADALVQVEGGQKAILPRRQFQRPPLGHLAHQRRQIVTRPGL